MLLEITSCDKMFESWPWRWIQMISSWVKNSHDLSDEYKRFRARVKNRYNKCPWMTLKSIKTSLIEPFNGLGSSEMSVGCVFLSDHALSVILERWSLADGSLLTDGPNSNVLTKRRGGRRHGSQVNMTTRHQHWYPTLLSGATGTNRDTAARLMRCSLDNVPQRVAQSNARGRHQTMTTSLCRLWCSGECFTSHNVLFF